MLPPSRVVLCASLLIALVLPASAGSIKTYAYTEAVTGLTNTNVTAAFSFNTKTHNVKTGTLTFTGAFGLPTFAVTFAGAAQLQNGSWVFIVNKKVKDSSGHVIAIINYTIDLSAQGLSYAEGSISNGKKGKNLLIGTFGYPTTAAEGGSRASYLIPAGLVIFGGIFLTGVRRRQAV